MPPRGSKKGKGKRVLEPELPVPVDAAAEDTTHADELAGLLVGGLDNVSVFPAPCFSSVLHVHLLFLRRVLGGGGRVKYRQRWFNSARFCPCLNFSENETPRRLSLSVAVDSTCAGGKRYSTAEFATSH